MIFAFGRDALEPSRHVFLRGLGRVFLRVCLSSARGPISLRPR